VQVILYEGAGAAGFGPLALLRPVFDLRCGALLLREKLEFRRPSWRVLLSARPPLADWVSHRYPGRTPADARDEQTLFLLAGVVADDALLSALEDIDGETLLTTGGTVVGALIRTRVLERVRSFEVSGCDHAALELDSRLEIPARVVSFPWELVHLSAEEIETDAPLVLAPGSMEGDVSERATIVRPARVSVGEGASIAPGAVLDGTEGSVVIAPGAVVMANAVVLGPAYVGAGSVLKVGARIYGGTAIGDWCKVGGEVECSIIHSYSNKQHDGFLGHSYLGSWVNLGAATDTSDLKNNYGTVRVQIAGEVVDTGSMFVGATIGDHSKTAIGTKLNTGTVIGIFANVVTPGLSPKTIPSFTWSIDGQGSVHDLEKAVTTARIVMARRGFELTSADEAVMRRAFEAERRCEDVG
jgi:UDP-N-acetylglucosamine diphosphorylase/glucosamine-1-phosphate N-acetyltransferase